MRASLRPKHSFSLDRFRTPINEYSKVELTRERGGGRWAHRKMGDSMAHCRAAPRETHSLAFMVREGSLPK